MKQLKYSNSITFLLPVKNRPDQLEKILVNCKKLFKNLNHFFLIIDASNSINHFKNLKIAKNYKNAKIFKQQSKGIQKGCIEGIKYIKTKYTSFLYDDDVMGDYITTIYKSNFVNNNIFSFGYGIVKDINEKVNFKKLSSISIKKENMISYYYGDNLKKEIKESIFSEKIILPVSPICTSLKTFFLCKWSKVLKNFVSNNKFRNYFFFKKEVGPDLLIFLLSIDESKTKINFFFPYSVKFSSHVNSISIIYGNSFLRIGYWLARICYFEYNKSLEGKNKDNAYTYLVSIGFLILISNLFNRFYFKNTLSEISKLMKNKKNKFSFKFFFQIIYNKILK